MSNTNKDISSQILSSTGTDSVFLKGPFGSGKTTIGQSWYRKLLKSGIPADEILIFTPQRSLGLPYHQTVAETQNSTAGFPTIATIHGFSRRMIQTFWPVIFDSTLFPNPRERPVFLSIESVLYHMRTVLTPFIEKGYFKDLHLEPNRLFSQILDNLNKSAFIGLSLDEVFTRLSQTWSGDPSRLITYNQAKEAAQSFRDYCLNNSLLDASLQIEVFKNILWKNEIFRNYTKSKFHHILVDNVEEDVPVFHDILLEWLPEFKSALIIYDEDGGYRTFLGADPISGLRFSTCCNKQIYLDNLVHESSQKKQLKTNITSCIMRESFIHNSLDFCDFIQIHENQFITQMVESVGKLVNNLIKNGAQAEEIAILGPYLSDALIFFISQTFQNLKIETHTFRPSRALINEPAVRAVMSLAKLIFFKNTNSLISHQEIRHALQISIENLDFIRADLISKVLFDPQKPSLGFRSFSSITNAKMRQRITYVIGEKIDLLQSWLLKFQHEPEVNLAIFVRRLFGELLSQPGFGMYKNLDHAQAISRLIHVIDSLRFEETSFTDIFVSTPDMIQAIESGIFSGVIPEYNADGEQKAVLLSPAHTFIMQNRRVKYQIWLDAGSLGWWERLNQPLTHPFVLSRNWDSKNLWSDEVEYQNNQFNMARLIRGLLDRCIENIFVETIHYNEQGYEPRGPLLLALQQFLKQTNYVNKENNV